MIRSLALALALALGLSLAPAAWATPAVVIDNGNAAVGLFGQDATAGFSFSTNSSASVVALDAIAPGVVRLYNASGLILASTMVSAGDPIEDTFFVHAIAPVTLAAGQTYFVAEDLPSPAGILFGAPILSVDPSITLGGGVSSLGLGGTPTTASGGPLFGPDFNVATATTTVPEPASLALLGAGLVGLAATRRRRPA